MTNQSSREERFARAATLLAEYYQLRESGDFSDFEAFCATEPECAAELRGLHEQCQRLGPNDDDVRLHERAEKLLSELQGRPNRFGDYERGDEIGRGGMGLVVAIRDRVLRREMAMKLALDRPSGPDARRIERFLEEAQITSQLDHPGIVPVHELGVDPEGRAYFTMRRVEGRNLSEVFALIRSGREGWTVPRAINVLLRVCETLEYAHSRGVVHRDLKPSNVMVGRFGEVFVMDWGLAKVLSRSTELAEEQRGEQVATHRSESSTDHAGATVEGDVMGTPAYMSPEQALGNVARVDARTDVYAMGAMLYELLAGHRPFCGPEESPPPAVVRARALAGPPAPLGRQAPTAAPELVAVCEKAMARSIELRYASVAELRAELNAFLEQRVVGAYRTGPWAEARKWVARNRAFAASLLGVLALVVIGGGGFATVRAEHGRAVAREQAIASTERETAQTIATHFDNALRVVFDGRLDATQRRDRLAQLSGQLASDQRLSPATKARVLRSLGEALRVAGDPRTAAARFSECLQILVQLSPRDSSSELLVLNALADVECQLAHFDDAAAHFEQALDAARQAGRSWVEPALTIRSNLIDVHLGRNDLDAAQTYADEIGRWFDANDAWNSPNGVALANQFGRIARRQDRFADALTWFQVSLDIIGDKLPMNDDVRLTMEGNVAATLQGLGMHRESETLAQSVIARTEGLAPSDHPHLLAALETLSAALLDLGREREAEAHLRRVLAARLASFGSDHPEVAKARANLATALLKLQCEDEALELATQATDSLERQVQVGSHDHVRVLHVRGRAHAALGHVEPAVTDFERVIALTDARGPGASPVGEGSLEELVAVFVAAGRWDEAQHSIERLLAVTPPQSASHAAREAQARAIRERVQR